MSLTTKCKKNIKKAEENLKSFSLQERTLYSLKCRVRTSYYTPGFFIGKLWLQIVTFKKDTLERQGEFTLSYHSKALTQVRSCVQA